QQTLIADVKALLAADGLPQEFGLEEADCAPLVDAALARYSQDRPRRAHKDYAGDGAAYDFALPADWDRALSIIEEVEYPQGEREPIYLQRRDWTLYAPGTSQEKLRLLRDTPQSGKTVRLFYTLPHAADGSSTTVPPNDLKAVAWLAAAGGCGALARRFAQASAPTLGADAMDHQSKAAEYTKLGRELERAYEDHIGRASGPSGATLDWDERLSQRRGDYLTHGGPEER
ncbi:MAG: hypothetical protein AABZ64_14675, partial [Nitrospinota bacterium]